MKRTLVSTIRKWFYRAFDADRWLKGLDAEVGRLADSGERVTYDLAMSISTVYSCARIISKSISTCPLILYQENRSGQKKPAIDTEEYWMLKNQPNPWTPAASFWGEFIKSWLIRGNAYAWTDRQTRGPGAGTSQGIWFLHPDQVYPKRAGRQLYFEVYPSGAAEDAIQEKKILYPGDIMYWANDAQNGVCGRSILEQQKHLFGLARSISKWQSKYFRQGIVPGAVLETDEEWEEEQVKEFETQWNKLYAGADNAHKAVLMPSGVKFRDITMKANDVAIIQQYNLVERQIASLFRVPLHKLQNHEHSTFSNVEHLNIEFVQDCLRPICEELEQVIEMQFLTEAQRRAGYSVKFKLDALLRGSTKERNESNGIAIQNGWKSRNEVRIEEDLDPIEGLDDILVPLNMSPNGETEDKNSKKRLLIVDTRGTKEPRISEVEGESAAVPPQFRVIPSENEDNNQAIGAFRGILEKEFSLLLTREREKIVSSAKRLGVREFESWMNAFAERQERNYSQQFESLLPLVSAGLGYEAPDAERIRSDAKSYKLRMQSDIRALLQASRGSWPIFLLKLEEHYQNCGAEASAYTDNELQKMRGISDAA